MRYSLEEYGEVYSLISEAHAETVVDFRNGGISYGHLVEGVDDTVAVHVAVLDVSRTNVSEVLLRPVVDVFLVLEKTFCDKTELLVVSESRKVLV